MAEAAATPGIANASTTTISSPSTEEEYKISLANLTETYGAYDEKTVDALFALGKHYVSQRRFEEAQSHLRQANDRYYNLFGSTDKDVKTWASMEALYGVLLELEFENCVDDAGALCEDLMLTRQKHYGKDDTRVLEIARDLEGILRRLDGGKESQIFHRYWTDEAIEALRLYYGGASDVVHGGNQEGGETNQQDPDDDAAQSGEGHGSRDETDASKDLAALHLRSDNESGPLSKVETSTTPSTSEPRAPRPNNPFLDDNGNLKSIFDGCARAQSTGTIRDYLTPGNTLKVTFYPYQAFNSEEDYRC